MGVTNKRTITKTRRKTRDVDQVKKDLLSASYLAEHKNNKAPEDLPGLGRNYCVECARWFDTEDTLANHLRGKPHKRRLKQLRDEADAEAEAATRLSANNAIAGRSTEPLDDIDMAT